MKGKMLKKILVMLVAALVFGSFLSGAVAISTREAEKLAAVYAYEGEHTEANGLLMGREIYYEGKPYYEIGFFRNETGQYVGSVIVDATTGEVVKDKGVLEKIVYVMVRNQGPDFSPEGLDTTKLTVQSLRTDRTNLEQSLAFLRQTEMDPLMTGNTKVRAKTVEDSLEKLIGDTVKFTYLGDEIYGIQKGLTERLEVERVNDFVAKNDEFAEYLNTTYTEDIKEYKEAYAAFMDSYISDYQLLALHPWEKQQQSVLYSTKNAELEASDEILVWIEKTVNSWEREKVWVREGHLVYKLLGVNKIQGDMINRLEAVEQKPTPPAITPIPTAEVPEKGVPGFEAGFAIVGLLAVAYQMLKKDKKQKRF